MSLSARERDGLLSAVRRIAGEEIMPRFRNLGAGDISEKSGRFDLVTQADTRTEARITKAVATLMPDVVVVGEEAVSEDASLLGRIGESGRVLIVDPVDGTWNFARGLAVFGMILALVENGKTVWGLIYDPSSDTWIEAAEGQGAWHEDASATRRPLDLGAGPDALVDLNGYVHMFLFKGAERERLFAKMPAFGRALALRCSAWEYRMMAEGHGDFCLSPVLNAWDHAAGALIVVELGGIARCLDGRDYVPTMSEGRLLVARSENVWQTVAEALDGVHQP